MSVRLCLAESYISMLGQNLLDLSLSLSGKVFTWWDRTPLIDMLCWIETAPARVVLCNFRSTTMRPFVPARGSQVLNV